MRAKRSFWAAVCISMLAMWAGTLMPFAQGAEDSYAGTWKGTWEGGGSSGSFDIVLARDGDGQWTGSVAVGSGLGDYNAKFSKAAFSAADFSSAYDYPPDPMGEVTLAGKFNAKNASGTWALGPKGSPGQAMASGSWSVVRK